MLIVVSRCSQCGSPIYAPEHAPEVGAITVRRTCACVPFTLSYALPMTESWPSTTVGLTPQKP